MDVLSSCIPFEQTSLKPEGSKKARGFVATAKLQPVTENNVDLSTVEEQYQNHTPIPEEPI